VSGPPARRPDEPTPLRLGAPVAETGPSDPFAAFDEAVERAVGRFRGNKVADAVAAVVSNLGDYGFIWAVIAAGKGRRRGPERKRAMRALTVAGIVSSGTNTAAKTLVRRPRPEQAGQGRERFFVRRPRSSSFPSGHTLAAFCTATILADTAPQAAAYLGLASAIALSRVHLQDHHPSDIVGGAVIGTAAGALTRGLLRR
jgi:undecaprenyl-diphosphatase